MSSTVPTRRSSSSAASWVPQTLLLCRSSHPFLFFLSLADPEGDRNGKRLRLIWNYLPLILIPCPNIWHLSSGRYSWKIICKFGSEQKLVDRWFEGIKRFVLESNAPLEVLWAFSRLVPVFKCDIAERGLKWKKSQIFSFGWFYGGENEKRARFMFVTRNEEGQGEEAFGRRYP